MSNPSPFGNHGNSGAIWCRIARGKIVRQATEGTPGAVRIEKKNREGEPTGEIMWELHDDTVSGRITSLTVKEREFHGEVVRQLIITLAFMDLRICVVLKEGDRYWRYFMMRLPNINTLHDVTLAPYDFEPQDGGRRIGLNILQDGEKVQPVWTRDNPGELPHMDRVVYKGKERADFTKQDEWLVKNILTPTAEKLAALDLQRTAATGEPEPEAVGGDDTDDLPF